MSEGLKGTEILVKCLKEENVKHIFGFPGGSLIPLYNELYEETDVRNILVRHEQGAVHAADGYARVSGNTGVCMATSGPGATNLITGLLNATMDSIPLVAFTGQVATKAIGTDAFQEADTFGITMPITKHNFLVKSVDRLSWTIKGAFKIANSGRKGAVVIDLPNDVQQSKSKEYHHGEVKFAGYNPNIVPNPLQLKRIAQKLIEAERPLILAGGGIIHANASDDLRLLAEYLGAGVVTTLMGKGAIPENHPLSLGMVGMHGRLGANKMINSCDALLVIGCRFSDRTTGWGLDSFAPGAIKIHCDIDSSELNKNIPVDFPLVGDASLVIRNLIKFIKKYEDVKKDTNVWGKRVNQLHGMCEECETTKHKEGKLTPEVIIKTINNFLDDNAIVTTEVGQNQMFAAHYYITRKPRQFISSGGLGTMGFGFPAAIGAKVAKPDSQVLDIAGDGSFLMVCQELATAVAEDIPVVVAVLNNSFLGMVRQWQELFWDKRYSGTKLGTIPDFVKLAESFGAYGERVESVSDIEKALKNAFDSGVVSVLDFKIESETNILPMIPPGGRVDEMIGVGRCQHK